MAPATIHTRSAGRVRLALLTICAWSYLALLVSVWAAIRFGGDRWWVATLLLFGPRMWLGFPLLVLAPAAVAWNGRLWRPLAAATLILLGPILGLCIPWVTLWAPQGPSLRVLTCNINGESYSPSALADLIVETHPDFVALQKCGIGDPLTALAGWHVVRRGELAVASRWPLRLDDVLPREHSDPDWREAYVLICTAETPYGPVSFCTLHSFSPHYGLANMLDRKMIINPSKSALLVEETAQRLHQAQTAAAIVEKWPTPLIIAGDFNMPADSNIYRSCWSRWENAFSRAGWGIGYTVSLSQGGLTFYHRVDHVLCGPELCPARCWIGPDIKSNHRPLIAELRWRAIPPTEKPTSTTRSAEKSWAATDK